MRVGDLKALQYSASNVRSAIFTVGPILGCSICRSCLVQMRDRAFGADLMDRPPKSAVDQAAFQRLLVPSSIRAQSRRRIGKSLLDRRERIEQQIAFRFFSAYTAALCSAGRRACRSRWERPCDAADFQRLVLVFIRLNSRQPISTSKIERSVHAFTWQDAYAFPR